VFPASHRAGSNAQALPMGARLRLKASKDLSGLAPEVQKIFRAMKTYGLIVADNGSDMFVSGAFDPRWNNDVLNPAFRALTAGDFDVVQLGWRGGETPPPPCSAPGPPSALTHAKVGLFVTLTWSAPAAGGAVTSYVIEAGSASGASDLAVIPTGSPAPIISGVAPPGRYYVRAKAQNACGLSTPSNEILVTLP
jgi:hypothetical protein